LGDFSFNIEVYCEYIDIDIGMQAQQHIASVFNFSGTPENIDGLEIRGNFKEGQDENVQATAYVPLTSCLIKMFKEGHLDSLEPPTVEKFLIGMYWFLRDIVGFRV
jgi:hypothetical protein